jgi:hypothetical protein
VLCTPLTWAGFWLQRNKTNFVGCWKDHNALPLFSLFLPLANPIRLSKFLSNLTLARHPNRHWSWERAITGAGKHGRCEQGCGWGELVRRTLHSFPCSAPGSPLVLLLRWASPSPAWRAWQRRHPAGPRAPSARRRHWQRGQGAEWVNGHAGSPQQLAGRSLLQPRHPRF